MPTTLIPITYQLPVLALLILGGAIAWAAGYRLFRFVLTLFGFYIGALAAIGSNTYWISLVLKLRHLLGDAETETVAA